MRRVAFLFVLAVFAPSLVLAWLAVSSLRDQQYVLERQLALVYQGLADRMTRDAEDYLAERQREFAARVETLLDGSTPGDLAVRFDDAIRQQWPFADVGFTVQLPGTILSPAQSGRPEARKFWIANSGFLANREQTIECLRAPLLRGRVRPHPIFGPWDGYQWLLATAAHTSRHTDQIRELQAVRNYLH